LLNEDRRARQGAWLLILSLGIFFFASMLLYLVYVLLRLPAGAGSGMVERLTLPRGFATSTVALVGISIALHQAAGAARSDQWAMLLWSVVGAIILALVFFGVQTHAMQQLLTRSRSADSVVHTAYPFTLFLALVHALHVVGGMVGLIWVLVNTLRKKYDHERHWGVQFCALYWHFLDAVWLVMISCFCLACWIMNTR
jgi:cytochrome c oxidase subunit 3